MVSALDVMTPNEHKARRLSILAAQFNIQEAQAKAAAQQQEQERTRQLRQFFAQHGAGIARGDQEATDALAAIDPEKAIELSGKRITNEKTEQDLKVSRFDLQKNQFDHAKARMDYVMRALTAVENADPSVRGILYKRELAAYKQQFPDLNLQGIPEDYDPNVVRTMLGRIRTASEQLSALQASPEYIRQKAEAEREPIPQAAQRAGEIARAQAPYRTRQGTSVTLPDGTTIESGDLSDSGGLRAPTINRIEGDRVASSNQLAGLARIEQSFKPEFLQIGKRTGLAWNSLKARMGNLPQSEQQELSDFAQFRADTTENLNTTIRAITGAALSPGEAERIGATVPVSGTGVFDGDDPVTFKAKLDRSVDSMRMAIIRQNIWRSRGMQGKPWEAMPLGSVKEFVNRRGDELAAEIKKANPRMDRAAIAAEVRERLRREIGYGGE